MCPVFNFDPYEYISSFPHVGHVVIHKFVEQNTHTLAHIDNKRTIKSQSDKAIRLRARINTQCTAAAVVSKSLTLFS